MKISNMNENETKQYGYSKRGQSSRVKIDESHVRTVECRVQFLKFGNINVTTELFRAVVLIKSKWTECGLINSYDPDVHWSPELFVENWKPIPVPNNIQKITYSLQQFPDSESTVITESREITGDFWERFELHEFPLDIQELSLTLCSKLDSSQVKIIQDQDKLSTIHPRAYNTFENQQVYQLHSMVNITNVASYEQDSHYKHLELNYQVGNAFHAAIRISRKSNMYVINSFSLVFIVTGLTFTSFVDSPEFANNRNKSLFSLLLTLFAYKITVSAQLPSVSYLTLIDKYMLLSILFTGSLAVWNAVLDGLNLTEETAKNIDQIAFYVFIAVFVCIHVFVVIMIALALMKIMKLNKEDMANALHLRHLSYDINSYSY